MRRLVTRTLCLLTFHRWRVYRTESFRYGDLVWRTCTWCGKQQKGASW